jgi:hypothetical protein
VIKIKNRINLDEYFIDKKNKIKFETLRNTYLSKKDMYDYNDFINYIESNLESLICSTPNILDSHIDKIKDMNINLILNKKSKINELTEVEQRENEFIKILRKEFNFDNLIDKPELADKINLNCCPYCNREWIFKIIDTDEKNTKRTLSSLDHFYDKGRYPYLALSYFNLIPSCNICNSKFKGTKDFHKEKHLNPYEDSFNEKAKFSHFFENVTEETKNKSLLSKERISLKVESVDKNDSKTENTIKTFRLNPLYDNHKDIVLELIQKREIYPDSYIDDLFHQYEGSLFKNREDVLRHITGGYIEDKDIDKRPLSKLIKDISEELDLI